MTASVPWNLPQSVSHFLIAGLSEHRLSSITGHSEDRTPPVINAVLCILLAVTSANIVAFRTHYGNQKLLKCNQKFPIYHLHSKLLFAKAKYFRIQSNPLPNMPSGILFANYRSRQAPPGCTRLRYTISFTIKLFLPDENHLY